MHVAQIGFFEDPRGRRPRQLLEDWTTLVDTAECAAAAGMRVSVVQSCRYTESIRRGGVDYHFLPWPGGTAAVRSPSGWAPLLAALRPDIYHVHGLHFARATLALAALSPHTPIVLQDHASRPPRPWRRRQWRRCSSVISGVSFCAQSQARPFLRRGLFRGVRVFEIPESTSRFRPGDGAEARRLAGLEGHPAILWVGHLDRNKDPLAVLEGIARAARELRELTLYCCFGRAPLLRRIEQRIARDPRLRARVRLLGSVPHERIELLMRAADLFVLGSHREGSGYALIEALACGLPPVVTDIPSFRALTGGGAVGALWPCGDSRALAEALIKVAPRLGAETRAAVRRHFERRLSSEAVGVQLAAMYQEAVLAARAPSADGSARGAGESLRVA